MKQCPRCELRKPDACFVEIDNTQGHCTNCVNLREWHPPRKKKVGGIVFRKRYSWVVEKLSVTTTQPAPIDPNDEDQKLIEICRRERQLYFERGAREIKKSKTQGARRPPKFDAEKSEGEY